MFQPFTTLTPQESCTCASIVIEETAITAKSPFSERPTQMHGTGAIKGLIYYEVGGSITGANDLLVRNLLAGMATGSQRIDSTIFR